MSPRSANPAIRDALVETAARILSVEGPAALSARRLASEVGASTMAIYTHFRGMEDVVREVTREGFARLAQHLATVETTDDPVADLAALGRAYRASALGNPHRYTVMVGGSAVAGFQLSEEDRKIGAYTMRPPVKAIRRCFSTGRFRPTDGYLIAYQYWCSIHGHVTLEIGGYFLRLGWADRCFDALLRDFAIGAGDRPESATKSTTRR